MFGNAGQTNYGAAKAGIAAFTIICGLELGRYGVLANAIAPVARTRMTEQLMGGGGAPAEGFDALDPANISPLVVWLGSNDNVDVTGRVFLVDGDRVSVAEGWRRGPDRPQRRDALGARAAHEGRARPRGQGAAQLHDGVVTLPGRLCTTRRVGSRRIGSDLAEWLNAEE